MKIYVIAAKIPDAETPWIINAWDEWTADENLEGWNEAIEEAKRKNKGAEIRIGIVEVPDNFLSGIFKPVVAKGTILQGHQGDRFLSTTPIVLAPDKNTAKSLALDKAIEDDMEHPKSEGGIGA